MVETRESVKHRVEIIGAPMACAEGVRDRWREVATWVAGQIHARFGASVQVRYHDLFDPDCPALPDQAQLPVVLVDGQLVSSGRGISIPLIRKTIEVLK